MVSFFVNPDLLVCFLTHSEQFYLVLWPNEETVSIHSTTELKESLDKFRDVSSLCTIQFGRTLYEGKIACVGKFWLIEDA